MLPLWKRYADGFVFLTDACDDGTDEFLNDNAAKYNILGILNSNRDSNKLDIESDDRQRLFDNGLRHSSKLICLDSDEYLDGHMTKEELEGILDQHPDHLLELLWIQYTSQDEVRVDGPWGSAWSPDRVGSYTQRVLFPTAQMHSQHMPYGSNRKGIRIPPPHLFISHLQWIDKKAVATKQYYWKVVDYVNRTRFNAKTIDVKEYDVSVNNFQWQCVKFPFPLKVKPTIYQDQDITKNYKYQFIKESVTKYSIPNLNDWGMGIH